MIKTHLKVFLFHMAAAGAQEEGGGEVTGGRNLPLSGLWDMHHGCTLYFACCKGRGTTDNPISFEYW